MSNLAIEFLITKRQQVILERDKMIEKYYLEIQELDEAIEAISGKKVSEVVSQELYDDAKPGYIRNTEDGI
jgi:hypothetical protein